MLCYLLPYSWGYSSVVEHSTADREVPGSNPGVPDILTLLICSEVNRVIYLCCVIYNDIHGDIAQW